MKKIVIAVFVFISLMLFASSSFAQTLYLVYDGTMHTYVGNVLTLKLDGEVVETDVPPIIIDDRSLVPVRAVFEKMGAAVNWDAENRKVQIVMSNTTIELIENDRLAVINGKGVPMDVPYKIINDRTMVPVRFISEQLNMNVGWDAEKYIISINRSTLGSISHSVINGKNEISINIDSSKNYNVSTLENPSRIVLDIPNVIVSAANSYNISSNRLKNISYEQYNSTTARIIFEVVGQPQYSVQNEEGRLRVSIDDTAISASPTPSPTPTSTPTPSNPSKTVLNNSLITHNVVGTREEVGIAVNDYSGFTSFTLSNPYRLVIDLPNVLAPNAQTININKSIVKSIRYAYFNNTCARVVIDLNVLAKYKIVQKAGQLLVQLENPGVLPPEPDVLTIEGLLTGTPYTPAVTQGNISYYNKTDRVHFIIKGDTKLTQVISMPDGSLYFEKLYTGKYDLTGKKYTITFPSELSTLTSTLMTINDSRLNSISVTKNSTGTTTIVFDAKDQYKYHIHTRFDDYGNLVDTAITLFKPYTKADKLVVIDPGHGGWEVGASYKNLPEKQFNLDIALRLNALLKERGVNTYMLRSDDSYVGLRERAYIANELKATMFISIHNNAYNSEARGTETLYFPDGPVDRGVSGQRIAELIENQITYAIGTGNRGIIPRPGLAVLKYTTIPAALAEVAFLDNREDRELLLNESVRQNAALGICNAIIQALNEMK